MQAGLQVSPSVVVVLGFPRLALSVATLASLTSSKLVSKLVSK